MGLTREVLPDIGERLRAARTDVDDARLEVRLALARRDELAVHAVDEGMRQKDVAAAIGVKPPHLIRIIMQAGQDHDDDLSAA